MNGSYSDAYAAAGVDVTAGYRAVELIKKHIKRTRVEGALSEIGGFGGLFGLPKGYEEPILVSGTDGVGTKLRIAFLMDRHDSVGIDAVAMCVNDIICCGARPLFFLDYIACGKNIPEKIEQIVSGVADGCEKSGAALIGGETAEMPGFYKEDEYDIAGFAVGIVEKKKIPDIKNISEGDILIALPSSGLHSNGFSLVRKVLDTENADLRAPLSSFEGKTLGEVLLTPTEIYVKPVLRLFRDLPPKAVAHITGGGFYENIPRIMPGGLSAVIEKSKVKVSPIFRFIQERGKISERDMYNTFNMGVGMVLVSGKENAEKTLEILKEEGISAYIVGRVQKGGEKVRIC